jgi:hypothetical protein
MGVGQQDDFCQTPLHFRLIHVRADVHGMVRLTMGGVMVAISSKEPAWAYPGPSRGRRLHNKRVHPGPQFLVGSSGQPLLLSAIPPTLSATGHQSRPPAGSDGSNRQHGASLGLSRTVTGTTTS